MKASLASKDQNKEAFSISLTSRCPAPFHNRFSPSLAFLLLLMHLQKSFLLCFAFLTRFNSKKIFLFLPNATPACLDRPSIFCLDHLSQLSPLTLLPLSEVCQEQLAHLGSLLLLLDFLFTGMCSSTAKRSDSKK